MWKIGKINDKRGDRKPGKKNHEKGDQLFELGRVVKNVAGAQCEHGGKQPGSDCLLTCKYTYRKQSGDSKDYKTAKNEENSGGGNFIFNFVSYVPKKNQY